MYQKYQTDALVLGSRESGENDRIFILFTHEFGLVRARATAIRKETSRMRYALQNYARANAALVRGKRGWRLAGASAVKNAKGDRKGIAAFARISELVSRLVQGEEANPYLFAALAEAHDALMQEKCDAFGTIEIVCVARILYTLGYISTEALSLPAPRPGKFTVYVLRCENDALYIGQTQDLNKRWKEHVQGIGSQYTKGFKPVGIVHLEGYDTREEALAREHWLKTGFGRKWIRREIKAGRARQAGTALFTHTAYTGEALLEAETMKDKLLSSINKAIAETHL